MKKVDSNDNNFKVNKNFEQLCSQIELLEKEIANKNDEIYALRNIATLLLVSNDFITTAKKIFNYCRELTGARAGYVALLNKNGKENDVLFLEPGGLTCTVSPGLAMPIRGLRERAYTTGKVVYDNNYFNSEHFKIMPDGHIPLRNVMFAPLKLEGKTIGLLGLGEKNCDFTEQDASIAATLAEFISVALLNSRTLEMIKEKENLLSELVSTKDRFFSIIAHDLKNPFAALISTSEILNLIIQDNNPDIAKIKRYSKSIHESAIGGYRLLENLLKWANSQLGTLDFNPKHLNVNELINESLKVLENMLTEKNIYIINHIPKEVKIFADKDILCTVLRNLLSNAIKFSYPDNNVEINYALEEEYFELSITDNGVGMNEHIINNLFKVDKVFSSVGTNKEKGTGLGLLISKEFINKHCGDIIVKSTIDKGSKFIIRLPL